MLRVKKFHLCFLMSLSYIGYIWSIIFNVLYMEKSLNFVSALFQMCSRITVYTTIRYTLNASRILTSDLVDLLNNINRKISLCQRKLIIFVFNTFTKWLRCYSIKSSGHISLLSLVHMCRIIVMTMGYCHFLSIICLHSVWGNLKFGGKLNLNEDNSQTSYNDTRYRRIFQGTVTTNSTLWI